MESEKQPNVEVVSHPIYKGQEESMVYLSLIRYDNAIQAALYDESPKLGSMTIAYPLIEGVEQQSLFRGKHDQLSRALALLLVRQTNQIVYASVNLSEDARVSNDTIRQLIKKLNSD